MSDVITSDTTEPGVPASLTLEINPPIKHAGASYDSFVLREPTIGEVRKSDRYLNGGITQESLRNRSIWLISFVSGVPVPVIESCGISTLNRAMAYLNVFLELGRGTGES